MAHIGLIVEGAGDQEALPVLLRTYLNTRNCGHVRLARPINTKGRGNLIKAGSLERFVRLAASEPGASGVLVLCDSDGDVPASLLKSLVERCSGTGVAVRVAVGIAVREFENWIVASSETVANVTLNLQDWEGSGAVAVIRDWRAPRKYVKPLHQAGLTAKIDPQLARERCPALDHLLREFDELIAHLNVTRP